MSNITRCTCCGRQLVSHNESTDRTITKRGAIADVNGVICKDCAEDLDENGMFPEEYIRE